MTNKNLIYVSIVLLCFMSFMQQKIGMKIRKSITIDSLGACQGISWQKDRIFLYGDREVGVVREYKLINDNLEYTNKEFRLTANDKDEINHPTGIAYNGTDPTFIGNTTRMNPEGTEWKAVIYCVNWKRLLKTHTLDGNIINRIDDDVCIQGTRPEYVKYNDNWYVATADYGNRGNEVRLYDPNVLKKAKKTSDKGVLFKKFTCSPLVQNLFWIKDKNILVLVQNQAGGRKWRFTYLDLKKSIESGKQYVISEINVDEKVDELEGFSMPGSSSKGIAVTSSKQNNVTFTTTVW